MFLIWFNKPRYELWGAMNKPLGLSPWWNIAPHNSCVVYRMINHDRKKINPLPHLAILGSSNSAANRDMMSEIWTNGDTII